MQPHTQEVYPNPPIVLVSAEIRYPHLSIALNRLEGLLGQAFRDELPLRRRPVEHEFKLTKETVTQERRSILQFASRDFRNAVTLSSDTLIVETTDYQGFSNFLPLLRSAIESIGHYGEPAGVDRIGLRYIDEVRVPHEGQDAINWHQWIDASLVAPSTLSPGSQDLSLSSWRGRLDFTYDNENVVTLRYGKFDDGATADTREVPRPKESLRGPFFLIDIDSHWAPINYVPEFQPEAITERLISLHGPVRSIFDAAITRDLVEEVLRSEPWLS